MWPPPMHCIRNKINQNASAAQHLSARAAVEGEGRRTVAVDAADGAACVPANRSCSSCTVSSGMTENSSSGLPRAWPAGIAACSRRVSASNDAPSDSQLRCPLSMRSTVSAVPGMYGCSIAASTFTSPRAAAMNAAASGRGSVQNCVSCMHGRHALRAVHAVRTAKMSGAASFRDAAGIEHAGRRGENSGTGVSRQSSLAETLSDFFTASAVRQANNCSQIESSTAWGREAGASQCTNSRVCTGCRCAPGGTCCRRRTPAAPWRRRRES